MTSESSFDITTTFFVSFVNFNSKILLMAEITICWKKFPQTLTDDEEKAVATWLGVLSLTTNFLSQQAYWLFIGKILDQ